MKNSIIFLAFSVLSFSAVNAQTFNINCNFVLAAGQYTCQIIQVTVTDNPNANFVIGGLHQQGRSNNDVIRVWITSSNIPFIIPQLFTTFPNVILLDINGGGLTRIQTNAFANAGNLQTISILNNQNFRSVEASAFNGAVRLNTLDMSGNVLENIDENAFFGANSLQNLLMGFNQIRELKANVFAPLNFLSFIFLNNNFLTSLDGRLFANNRLLLTMFINSNQIDAIGRNFLDNLDSLQSISLAQNICVDAAWSIRDGVTLDIVRAGLATCFNNAVEPPPNNELRRFILEVRGPLTLRFENGTNIVTV